MNGAWLVDQGSPDLTSAFRVTRLVHEEKTLYQYLEVYENPIFGRMLVLDGAVQTTEHHEFAYHEMLVHPTLCTHPAPQRVLIIGGGDGGALEESLKHPLEQATLVEIDEAVVRTSRQYLASVAGRAFEDPRARVIIGDGIAFVAKTAERFDVVIVDSTDPVGPAVGLFSPEFYGTIKSCLTSAGLLVVQSGSALYQPELSRSIRRTMRPLFPVVRTYVASVVEYPGVLWSFTVGSLGADPATVAPETIAARTKGFGLSYYTALGHRPAFAPPPFLRDVVNPGDEDDAQAR